MQRPRAVLTDLDCTLTDRAATVRAFAGRFVEHFGADLAPQAGGAEDAVEEVRVGAPLGELGAKPVDVLLERLDDLLGLGDELLHESAVVHGGSPTCRGAA